MAEAIHSLTFFPGQFATIPGAEYAGLTARGIIERVAPEDGPHVLTEKAQAPHFVTCSLAVGLYIGKTAARFPVGAEGKQRSTSHVTESSWFAFDCDDITTDDVRPVLNMLDGRVFAAYSTHSHGQEPGKVRMRVLVFADRVLGPSEWVTAWHVIDECVFSGRADKATAKMHQAAAVWAAHPARISHSFRHVGYGQLLSVDKLLSLAPKPQPKPAQAMFRSAAQHNRTPRYADALRWLDSGDYSTWRSGLMSLRAGVEVGDMSEHEGRELWLTWSATAPTDKQARNEQSQYNPAAMWDRNPKLTTPAHILAATLFANARDRAQQCLEAELPGPLSKLGERAKHYLRAHHQKLLEQIGVAA